jgi:hypothetical protein
MGAEEGVDMGKGGIFEKNYNECRSLYSFSNSTACSKFDSGSHVLSTVG